MKCALCDGVVRTRKGTIEFDNKVLGKVRVPNLTFYECNSCKDQLLTPHSSATASAYIKEKEQEAIDQMPIGDFVDANEAARILSITKQAFSKNPAIKRGLILSTTKGKRRFFLKKSVELFKEKGNGKFLLPLKKETPADYDKLLNWAQPQPVQFQPDDFEVIMLTHSAITPYSIEIKEETHTIEGLFEEYFSKTKPKEETARIVYGQRYN